MAKRILSKQDTHTVSDLFGRDDWNFAGIADAHGIESFQPRKKLDAQTVAFWNMRAQANRQRHALVYFAKLDKETEGIVRPNASHPRATGQSAGGCPLIR